MIHLNDSNKPLGDNPYWVFISFLYAWIAANIAEHFSHVSANWSEYERSKQKWWSVPVYSHLFLAAFVVGTSWLGWTQAIIEHNIGFGDVIAPSSLLLIVDFWILGTYFSFVAAVNKARLSSPHQTSPSSEHAAYWVMLILLAYLAWDSFTYYVFPRWIDHKAEDDFWPRSWMTVICLLLAIVAFMVLKRVKASRPFWTMTADISLIALILLYRALKQIAISFPHSATAQIGNLTWYPLGNWLNGFAWGCLLAFVILSYLASYFGYRLRPGDTPRKPIRLLNQTWLFVFRSARLNRPRTTETPGLVNKDMSAQEDASRQQQTGVPHT